MKLFTIFPAESKYNVKEREQKIYMAGIFVKRRKGKNNNRIVITQKSRIID